VIYQLTEKDLAKEKVVSSEYVFKGRAVNLRVDTVEVSGCRTTREIVEHPECVVVVPVDTQGNILMVRQFRHAVGRELLELPAGGIEPGEDPASAVRREMSEETGFSPKNVTSLGGFYSAPGFCTEHLRLFLATDLTPNRLVAEDTEEIDLVLVPVDKAPALLDSGQIVDAKSIAGLSTYLRTTKSNTKSQESSPQLKSQ